MYLFSNSLRSNENNLVYFRKQLGKKENESFLLVKPCFRVIYCVEINLQLLLLNIYLSLQFYALLMRLISAIPNDLC